MSWRELSEVLFKSAMPFDCVTHCVYIYVHIQATEEVSKSLVAMKEIIYGTNKKEPQTEAVAQLAQELYNSGLLSTLVADLQLIDFEVRANVSLNSVPQGNEVATTLTPFMVS